jgi:hypothetical protein
VHYMADSHRMFYFRMLRCIVVLVQSAVKEFIISVACSRAGVAQLVELQPSKLVVASSSLVSRSRKPGERKENVCRSTADNAHVAQSVERFLGKEEVHRFDSGRGLHGNFSDHHIAWNKPGESKPFGFHHLP